jgi:hypothetical protein
MDNIDLLSLLQGGCRAYLAFNKDYGDVDPFRCGHGAYEERQPLPSAALQALVAQPGGDLHG